MVGTEPDVPDLDMSATEGQMQMSVTFDVNAARSQYRDTDFWVDLSSALLILERPIIALIK
jgi:hypothetical protein